MKRSLVERVYEVFMFGVFLSLLVMLSGTRLGFDATAVGGILLILLVALDVWIVYRRLYG